MTTDLKTVALTILDNFGNDPRILQATLIAMAVIACLHLDDLPHCIGLNLIGPAASSKTTVLDFFGKLSAVYRSDSFTPRSFSLGVRRRADCPRTCSAARSTWSSRPSCVASVFLLVLTL